VLGPSGPYWELEEWEDGYDGDPAWERIALAVPQAVRERRER